jgi:signal peptidase I
MKMKFKLFSLSLVFFFNSCKIEITETATAQSAANEPTIKKGETITYSKGVAPKLFDIICFLGEVPTLPDRYLMTYRLCGRSGDTVQIRKGDFYLNGKLADNKFSLKHNYIISREEYNRIKSQITIDENYDINMTSDTSIIPIEDEIIAMNKINAKRQILSPSFQDSIISGKFNQPWNQDNFGPVVVPKDTYFVLGDNRHDAWDSRFRGFISKKDFLGTVVLHK